MATVASPTCPFDSQYGSVHLSIQRQEGVLQVIIETARLRIQSVNTNEHLSQLIDLYGSKEVNRLVGAGETLDAQSVTEKVARWNQRLSENNPFVGYVVLEKAGDFVGDIILKPLKDKEAGPGKCVDGAVEIGYLSVPAHWGKGYGKEYTHAMVCHLIPALKDQGYTIQGRQITSIMATTSVENFGSQHVLSKFMDHTGTRDRYGSPREWYTRQY
ncbi:MAG: GNAT family N-acetyltransferase [Verrucomicrobia bacterium]|nr:GNAT family N-acetyltransferase [Verrucomicrobiota bacterium]